jgi:predicted CXXCH cytochrome family protein
MISIAAALALFAAPAFAAAPGKVSLEAKTGNVTFDHAGAGHAKIDCTKCHADAKGGKIADLNKDKGHAMCQDCHKQQAKGPTKCAECHKKG